MLSPLISISLRLFSMQILKFQRRSCKPSFLFPPDRQSAPESLLAGQPELHPRICGKVIPYCYKLDCYCISGPKPKETVSGHTLILYRRTQSYVVNGHKSCTTLYEWCALRDSFRHHIFSSTYKNEFPNCLRCSQPRMYADDTINQSIN